MKTVNVFNYFPLKDAAMLERFLKKDAEFEERKKQFFTILILSKHEDKKKFGTDILKAVFSEEYWMSHRWPTALYDEYSFW